MARGAAPGHKSLVRTLIWGLTLPTVVIIIATIAVLMNRVSGTVSGLRQATLSSQARELINRLDRGADGALVMNLPEATQRLYGPNTEFAFAILDRTGTAILASRMLAPLAPVDTATLKSGVNYFTSGDSSGQNPFDGATISFTRDGIPYWIQVTHGRLHKDALFDTVVEEFFEATGWIFILLLVALLVINIAIISRSLRPLRQAQQQAAAIGPLTTDIRLREAGMPSEILPLIHAVNSAFSRLEEGFRLQREFTANAAHELRTPLAVLTARIGKLHDKADAAMLMNDARLMNRIVGQLLKISQLEAISIGDDERADLSAIAVDATVYLGPVAIERNRSIAVIGASNPVFVMGNADLLGHAVRNLVENALEHTPEGTTATIAVSPDGSLAVTDAGAGIPDAARKKIFQRFWRSERSGNGAGLGLSIVERIVALHGGTIAVTDGADAEGNPLGAKFVMRFRRPVSMP